MLHVVGVRFAFADEEAYVVVIADISSSLLLARVYEHLFKCSLVGPGEAVPEKLFT